jgi:hypothetical protein
MTPLLQTENQSQTRAHTSAKCQRDIRRQCSQNAYSISSSACGNARVVSRTGDLDSLAAPKSHHASLVSLAFYSSNAKIRFQSFFMLMTAQPASSAFCISDCGKAPILVSGRRFAGPYAYSRSASSCSTSIISRAPALDTSVVLDLSSHASVLHGRRIFERTVMESRAA